jgi:hypothetical protein
MGELLVAVVRLHPTPFGLAYRAIVGFLGRVVSDGADRERCRQGAIVRATGVPPNASVA